MPLRLYTPHDSLAIATIKATCDLTDPLALYCRRINSDQHHHHQHTSGHKPGKENEGNKQWKTYIKSLQKTFELELLLPGSVCWVIYADHRQQQQQHNTQDENTDNEINAQAEEETVVGFAIWNRHGTSALARKWRAQGSKVSTRTRLLPSSLLLIHTYIQEC